MGGWHVLGYCELILKIDSLKHREQPDAPEEEPGQPRIDPQQDWPRDRKGQLCQRIFSGQWISSFQNVCDLPSFLPL